MKTKLITSMLLLSNMAHATTNWEQLIKETPAAKNSEVVVDKNYVQLKVVELPNEKIRFDGFTMLTNKEKIKLVIETDKTLKEACSDYVNLGEKFRFKASLAFNKSTINGDFNFSLNGKVRNSSEFENPISFGKTRFDELGNAKTPWTNSRNIGSGIDVAQLYSNVMNEGLQASRGQQVVIDLTSQNGLACDLAFGYIRPTLRTTVSYERSLPQTVVWVSEKNYSELYRVFNDEYKKSIARNGEADMKFNEAIVLGWSLGQLDSDVKDAVFKKFDRAPKLLSTLKVATQTGESNTAIWSQTADYIKPENTMTTQNMPIAFDVVKVEIQDL